MRKFCKSPKFFKTLALSSSLMVSLALGGCNSMMPFSTPSPQLPKAMPAAPITAQALESNAPATTQFGTGPVHIALILPLTQNGQPDAVGISLRNAAELAVEQSYSNVITVDVMDNQATPAGSRAAAQTALNNGDDLIVGPLISPNVRAVGQLARAAGKPEIAFSTDSSVASPGVYLLSFLVENDVDRIVDYAASRGKRSLAALIPDNQYGTIAAAAFQQQAAARGIRVQALVRYNASTLAAAVQKIAAVKSQINGLFIPEQAAGLTAVAQQLAAAGLTGPKVQLLGTGVWNDSRVMALPALQGAWYAAPENTGFNSFAHNYQAKFGTSPVRLATLSYDAVTLAGALARTQGSQRYATSILTNPSGFNGSDGLFRFRRNGLCQRGLAVEQITGGSARTISPAPQSFPATTAAR